MSLDTNQICIVGRLTRDPELSYTPANNTPVCKFSIANGAGGQGDNEKVNFFDVTVWNKTAENCGKYLIKGSQIVVVGKLVQDRYTNNEGKNVSKIYINGFSVQFVGGKKDDNAGGQGQSPGQSPGQYQQGGGQSPAQYQQGGGQSPAQYQQGGQGGYQNQQQQGGQFQQQQPAGNGFDNIDFSQGSNDIPF